jgi:hypothetical protein
MNKPNLGTIKYHPFPQIPNESVSFTVDEDMREIFPNDHSKTKSRRNFAKQLMGQELFDKLEEQNKQSAIDSVKKLREKRMEEYRKQLDEFEKDEKKTITLSKNSLNKNEKEMSVQIRQNSDS